MRRRDEMLGLNEYLAHLTKCFVLAGQRGHRTVGVLFGRGGGRFHRDRPCARYARSGAGR
jgi:hypothetical protein